MIRIAPMAMAAALAACGQGEPAGARTPPAPVGQTSATASSTPTAAPAVPETREFRDWRAVCDNGNRCAAYSGSDDGGWLMIVMDAGPEARPALSGGMSAFSGTDPVDGMSLIVDGKATRLRAGAAGSGASVAGARDAAAMTPTLAAARAIQLKVGETAVTIPTSGVAAALLWIDERQGRLGATTALLRKGDRAALTVPEAPALPVVAAAPAVAQTGLEGANDPQGGEDTVDIPLPAPIEALPAVKACREQTSYNEHLQKAVLAARLGRGVELWGVPCDSGAYNATYLMFVTGANGADPRPADLATWHPDETEEGRGEGLVNPGYDPATRVLTHFPRGRGIGDCGVIQSWIWTGRAFAPSNERSMGDCWGMRSSLWPTTWRTQ